MAYALTVHAVELVVAAIGLVFLVQLGVSLTAISAGQDRPT